MPFMGITLKRGDRFMETFYTDRWYNIFEIYDRDDGALKGWYCNVSRPALFEGDNCLSYVDLALDLWVAADGTQTVLDEDEFAELELERDIRMKALAALEELKSHFSQRQS
jgi:protein associated with RNAse G/E